MPEGHLVHYYARRQQALIGPTRVESPQGRFAVEAGLLDGALLVAVEPYGKHLFYTWEQERMVHVHLGMQGLFLSHSLPPPPPRRQVRMRVTGQACAFDLIAPRACELINPDRREAILDGLGPEPLRPTPDDEAVWKAVHESDAPIGVLLLDQRVVAGVGNVLRAEVLHAAGLHPAIPGSQLDAQHFERLWSALLDILSKAAEIGRIETVGHDRAVYKQERCARCGTPVERATIGGRMSYRCPACQP